MQTKIKNVYYCDFCGKKGMVKYIIEFHERYCTKNPAVAPKCFTCDFLVTDEFQVDFERGDYGEPDYVRNAKIFRCSAQDGKIVFTPKFVGKMIQHRKNSVFHLKDSASQGFEKLLAVSNPMPIKCDKFKVSQSYWYANDLQADTEYVEPEYQELNDSALRG